MEKFLLSGNKANFSTLISENFTVSLIFLLCCLFSNPAHTQRFAVATGNWNGAIWATTSGGLAGSAATPAAGDTVTINQGINVTVNIINAACASLALNEGTAGTATLTFNASSILTCSGNVTLGTGAGDTGSINMTNGGTFQIGGSVTVNALGTFTAGSGTIEYNAAGAQTVTSGLGAYHNLTLSNSGSKNTTGITVNGILSIEGTATALAAPTYGPAATLQYNTSIARTILSGPDNGVVWVSPFVATGGVIIANTGVITMGVAKAIGSGSKLTINSGATLNADAVTTTINGGASLLVNGTLDFSNASGAVQSGGTGTATLTMGSGGLIKTIDPAGLGPVAGGSIITGGSTWTDNIGTVGTVEYYRSSDNTGIVYDRNYNNLTISTTGSKSWTVGGARTVQGTITINAPLTLTGGTNNFNVVGDWIRTATATTGNLTMRFIGANQRIDSTTFQTLALVGAGTKTFNGAVTISGTLTINDGVVVNLGTVTTHSANALTLGGFGTPAGSFGSTSSAATNKLDLYFAPTIGILNVATNSCGAVTATIVGTNSICTGGTANLAVNISGGRPPYTVVYSGGTINNYTSGSNILVSPASTTTYTLTSVNGRNGCSATVTGSAIVTVLPLFTSGTISSVGQTICTGGDPAVIGSITAASGGDGGIIYKWQAAGADIPNSNSATYDPPSGLTTTTTYTRYARDGTCNAAFTASAGMWVVNVDATTAGGTVSSDQTVCFGTQPDDLILTDNVGSVLKWQKSSDAAFTSPVDIPETSTTLFGTAIGGVTSNTYFRAVVQNGACPTANSTPVLVEVGTTTTWNGTDWIPCQPSPNVDAIIAGDYTSGDIVLTAKSLTVSNNAKVLISSGATVTLSGALIADSGTNVTFENNANLVQTGAINENQGSIAIQRNSSKLMRLDYTLWSSPVAGQQLKAFSPATLDDRFYTYDTNTNLYVKVPAPNSVNFDPMTGYLIRMPNNHPTTPTIWPGKFTGVPNNGNYSFNLVNIATGKRFNLIGNPYPSPISMIDFVSNLDNSANITGALYFWRKTNNPLSPSYCTWTLAGFVSDDEAQVFDPNDVIRTGQGFFVEATALGATVVCNNDMRLDDHADQFFKQDQTIEKNRIWLNVTNTSGAFCQLLIAYITNATMGVDQKIDGKFFAADEEVALTSIINDVDYAIQGRALPFDSNDVVPLRFKTSQAGSYSISIDKMDGLFAGGQQVYLHDNLTGSVHDLKSGAYNFTSDSGTFSNRFEVVYQSSLSTIIPEFNQNQVIVYKKNDMNLVINSGNVIMQSVKIYDLTGRLLLERNDINKSEVLIKPGSTSELLIVSVVSDDGVTVTKKVVN